MGKHKEPKKRSGERAVDLSRPIPTVLGSTTWARNAFLRFLYGRLQGRRGIRRPFFHGFRPFEQSASTTAGKLIGSTNLIDKII